jgi:hypothetical protein
VIPVVETGGIAVGHAVPSLGPPPATVDLVSQVWNNFSTTVLPLCGGVAQEAVRTNRDPLEIGEFESVMIQKEILQSVYGKYGTWHTGILIQISLLILKKGVFKHLEIVLFVNLALFSS